MNKKVIHSNDVFIIKFPFIMSPNENKMKTYIFEFLIGHSPRYSKQLKSGRLGATCSINLVMFLISFDTSAIEILIRSIICTALQNNVAWL